MSDRGLGPVQESILTSLASGEWVRTEVLANAIDGCATHVRASIIKLRGRGFRIEGDANHGSASRGYRLLPFPNLRGVPMAYYADYYRMTQIQGFNAYEARQIIDADIEVQTRRREQRAA